MQKIHGDCHSPGMRGVSLRVIACCSDHWSLPSLATIVSLNQLWALEVALRLPRISVVTLPAHLVVLVYSATALVIHNLDDLVRSA